MTTAQNNNHANQLLEHFSASLSTAREELRRVETQIARLTRLARGTEDVQAQAADAVAATAEPAPAPATLQEKIEMSLRGAAMTVRELAAATGVTPVRITTTMRAMRKNTYNVGTETDPRWTWVVGDDAPIEDLARAVEILLRERPMTRVELVAATGARDNRIGGALRRIQRDGGKIMNLGNEYRARWFLMPPNVSPAGDGVAAAKLEDV